MKRDTSVERFWKYVEKTDDCWLWKGSTTKGYGQFRVRGELEYAHRFSYQLHIGEIPDDMWVLHSCDNPPCVRPEHLYLGTNDDNVKDRNERNRSARQSGATNPRAKLSERQVGEIREKYSTGEFLQKQLADEYSVSQQTISFVITERSWKRIR